MPEPLVKMFFDHGEGQRNPTLTSLMSTLKSILQGFLNVYIVFDALDESPERHRFLTLLRTIHDWGVNGLHLLAISRKERDIEKVLNRIVSHAVPMEERLVDIDIKLHVTKTLVYDDYFQMCSAEEKELIKTTLTEGAHGM